VSADGGDEGRRPPERAVDPDLLDVDVLADWIRPPSAAWSQKSTQTLESDQSTTQTAVFLSWVARSIPVVFMIFRR
jgi:hypothetical protein